MPTHTRTDIESDDGFALSPSGPYRSLKEIALIALCAVWALLGIFGHDPWKTEDASAFGIAHEMIERGDALVPYLAGEPFVDRPPLIYAAAAAAAVAFSPLVPITDAARIAAAIMLGLTMTLVAATAKELYGREFRWMAVLLFIGSVGLWDRAHQLSPEIGCAAWRRRCVFYGFALALRRPVGGGAIVGLGVAIAFLSRGFLGPLWLGLTAVALPAAFADWRTRRYALAMTVALLVAVPLAASWPLALASHAPEHLGRGGRRSRSVRIFLASCRNNSEPRCLAQESPVVRMAGAAARPLDAMDARPRVQRWLGHTWHPATRRRSPP